MSIRAPPRLHPTLFSLIGSALWRHALACCDWAWRPLVVKEAPGSCSRASALPRCLELGAAEGERQSAAALNASCCASADRSSSGGGASVPLLQNRRHPGSICAVDGSDTRGRKDSVFFFIFYSALTETNFHNSAVH